MKKIITFLLVAVLGFLAIGNFIPEAYAAETLQKKVNVNLTFAFDTDTDIVISKEEDYGHKVTINFDGIPSGNKFAYWIVNGVVKKDLEEANEFLATTDLNLVAVFNPTVEGQVAKHAVAFVDSNGKLLGKVLYVTPGGSVTAPAVDGLSKPGFEVNTTLPWKAQDDRQSLENVDTNLVFTLQYSRTNNTALAVNVTGGTSSNTTPKFNELVTVAATIADFTHWEENGQVVSYDKEYQFTALKDRNLEAKTDGENTPLVTLTGNLSLRENFESYLGQYSLPEGYELVETGVIASALYNPHLTLDSEEIDLMVSHSIHPDTNEFLRTINSNVYAHVRAFLTYNNGVEIETVYSPVVQMKQIYGMFADFETPTNYSYNSSAPVTQNIANIDGNHMLKTEVVSGASAGTVYIRLDEWINFEYSHFDYIEFDFKSYYQSGTAANMGVRLNDTYQRFEGYPDSNDLPSSQNWKSLRVYKHQFNTIFSNNRFWLVIQSFRTNDTIQIFIDNIKGGFLSEIEATEGLNDQFDLKNKFNIDEDDIIEASFRGETIENLSNFTVDTAGDLNVKIKRPGYLEENYSIDVLFNEETAIEIIDNFSSRSTKDFLWASGSHNVTVKMTDNGQNRSRAVEMEVSQGNGGLWIDFVNKEKFKNINTFDEVTITYKASYANGVTGANIIGGFRLRAANSNQIGSAIINKTFKTDGQWNTITFSKAEIEQLFISGDFYKLTVLMGTFNSSGLAGSLTFTFDSIIGSYNGIE